MTCEWFALCDREALVMVSHPILGAVPTCGRCANRQEVAELIADQRAEMGELLTEMGLS